MDYYTEIKQIKEQNTYLMDLYPEFKHIKENEHVFTVAIFGSARLKQNDPIYREIKSLAYQLGQKNFSLITGGGPGLMEAASEGHRQIRDEQEKSIVEDEHANLINRIFNIGLNIKLPYEEYASRHLDVKKEFTRFSERLEHFMHLSNAVIVSPGGIGTLLEFFYTWQLIQVHHIKKIPIILFSTDNRYDTLLTWIKSWLLEYKLIDESDLEYIYNVNSISDAVNLLTHYRDNQLIKTVEINEAIENQLALNLSQERSFSFGLAKKD